MNFWKNRKVFVTGHTGFKGSWLCLWLNQLGAKVTGFALEPPTDPSLFKLCKIDELTASIIGDIRDIDSLKKALLSAYPEIVIHMAAQPLVRRSYKMPSETFQVNVIGTVNLLEAVRECGSVRAVINVTTDKVYKNQEKKKGYIETDPLGGFDPYSTSKACSELVTESFRNSFFNPKNYKTHKVAIATARAGNVIGGGDWGEDRLVPDFIKAALKGTKIRVRNPKAVRPWQHVLEPLRGYMMLAEKLYSNGPRFGEAWNFGPDRPDAKPVEWVIKKLCEKWGEGCSFEIDKGKHPHETNYLFLDHSKASKKLGWKPKWDLGQALDKVIEWTGAYRKQNDLRKACIKQIEEYQ